MQEFTKKTSFYWSRSRRKKLKTAPAPKGLKSPAPLRNTGINLLKMVENREKSRKIKNPGQCCGAGAGLFFCQFLPFFIDIMFFNFLYFGNSLLPVFSDT